MRGLLVKVSFFNTLLETDHSIVLVPLRTRSTLCEFGPTDSLKQEFSSCLWWILQVPGNGENKTRFVR